MPTAFELLRTFDPAELRGDDGKWTGGAVHEAAKQFEQALKDTEEIGDNVNQSQGTYGDAAFVVHKGTGDVRMVFHDTETGDLRETDLSHEEMTDLADSLNEVSAHRSEIEAGEGFDDPEDGTPTRVVDYDFGPNREHNVSLWSDGVVKVKLYDDDDEDPFELHLHPEDAETGDDLADFVDIADAAAAESAAEDQVNHDFRAARRSGAAQPEGGQFALGGGRVTGHGKKVRTSKPKAKPAAQKRPAGPRKFSYNPKTGTGVGYGVKGGDPQVRILQADLNRLGLADEGGRTLAVDGRYGPHTTASVRALQASLDLPVTGQVDEALISKVSTLKALPHGVVKPKSPAHPPARTKPRVHAHRSADPYGGDMPSAVATRAPGHFDRTYALDDIQISRSGDGRTVEAYAAIFGQPYEVRDQHGHYMEVIDRAAFNRTLTGGAGRSAMCLYNHGMTVHGTADALSSVPLGTPLEVKPDGRGLLTVTRYNRSALADSVLESIRNGDIRSQSFRGRIIRSSPNTMPRATRSGGLPTITRHELGLTDYGPTPVPVNAGAEIMAVRSVTELIEDFQSLDVDEREELLRALDLSPFAAPDEADVDEDIERATDSPTSDSSELGAEDPSHPRHSGRLLIARSALLAELRIKGVIRRG